MVDKRILFIDHDKSRTGSTVSLEYLVKAFSESGKHVYVLTPKNKSECTSLIDNGAEILSLRKGRFVSIEVKSPFTNKSNLVSWKGPILLFHEIFKILWGILVVGRAIRKTKPLLIYVNEHVLLSASIASWIYGIPAVIHVRSPLLEGDYGFRKYLISRIILTFNKAVFAITEFEAKQLCPEQKEISKINIIGEFFPNAKSKDLNFYGFQRKIKIAPQDKIVAMLGGILNMKGTIDFIEAAESILKNRKNVIFVIAGKNYDNGDAEQRAYYDTCIKIGELMQKSGHLKIMGEINESLELIAASDIVVSPSVFTHFSRPVIEAWGFAKPVVASDTKHMRVLIKNNVNGLLYEVGNHKELAECVCRLLDDDELCVRLGSEGRKKTLSEYDADKNIGAILDICESLIKK